MVHLTSAAVISLCVLFVVCSKCSAQQTHDAPPLFTRFGVQDKTNPGVQGTDFMTSLEYVRAATISEYKINIFFCQAQNADTLTWEYSSDNGATFNATALWQINSLETLDSTPTVKRVIYDTLSSRVLDLTGHYRCKATNRFNYTSLSPSMRLLYPSYRTDTSAVPPSSDRSFVQNGADVLKPPTVPQFPVLVEPEDYLKFFPTYITYKWVRKIGLVGVALDTIPYAVTQSSRENRIHINEITGDLVFDYVQQSDATQYTSTGSVDSGLTNEYQCEIEIRGAVLPKLVARYVLAVEGNTVDVISRIIPVRTNNIGTADAATEQVVCIKGTTCALTCVFGGRLSDVGNSTGTAATDLSPIIVKDGSDYFSHIEIKPFGISLPDVISDATGTWDCSHPNSDDSAKFQVVIKEFPSLPVPLEDLYIHPNNIIDSQVKCEANDADSITFYINGEVVTSSSPSWVELSASGRAITIKIPQSASISCQMNNDLGDSYDSMIVVVYDAPSVFSSGDISILAENLTVSEDPSFDCAFMLDRKATKPVARGDIDVYWTSNISGDPWKKFRANDAHTGGIKSVELVEKYTVSGQVMFNTSITLVLDSVTVKELPNTVWRCVVEYRIPPRQDSFLVESRNLSFTTTILPVPATRNGVFKDWWIIGVVAGMLFFVVLIALIICCVRQNQGENYNVDKKERSAGHDPESEMKTYGFHDYKRPDQNPIQGSHASMNFSDHPVESDVGSMEEYGDIEPGRFNEDGSFIGQYGNQHP